MARGLLLGLATLTKPRHIFISENFYSEELSMNLQSILNKKATSKFQKLGQIYVVLLSNEIIKVGVTTVGINRLKAYHGIERYLLSTKIEDFSLAEKILIQETNIICGPPIKGREFFGGCGDEFSKIKSLTPKSTIEHGISPYKQYLIDVENDYKEYVRVARLKESKQ